MGLLDPATSDGRVIFFLPWQKQTIAGTTDLPCDVTHHPKPTEDEIQFILHEVKNYLNPDVEGKSSTQREFLVAYVLYSRIDIIDFYYFQYEEVTYSPPGAVSDLWFRIRTKKILSHWREITSCTSVTQI